MPFVIESSSLSTYRILDIFLFLSFLFFSPPFEIRRFLVEFYSIRIAPNKLGRATLRSVKIT